jgi:hypothetical protein
VTRQELLPVHTFAESSQLGAPQIAATALTAVWLAMLRRVPSSWLPCSAAGCRRCERLGVCPPQPPVHRPYERLAHGWPSCCRTAARGLFGRLRGLAVMRALTERECLRSAHVVQAWLRMVHRSLIPRDSYTKPWTLWRRFLPRCANCWARLLHPDAGCCAASPSPFIHGAKETSRGRRVGLLVGIHSCFAVVALTSVFYVALWVLVTVRNGLIDSTLSPLDRVGRTVPFCAALEHEGRRWGRMCPGCRPVRAQKST